MMLFGVDLNFHICHKLPYMAQTFPQNIYHLHSKIMSLRLHHKIPQAGNETSCSRGTLSLFMIVTKLLFLVGRLKA